MARAGACLHLKGMMKVRFEFFGEEYLKFRHFFYQNILTYMKVLVKEGWTDRDTGKKGEPRLQFVEVKHYRMYWNFC
jgi:hypothetical protein